MPTQFSATEYFNLPAEKVFAGLTDLDAAQHWMKGFMGIEKIKGTKVEPGAVWRESRKMFGRKATEEFEVVSVIPDKEIRLRIDGSKGSSGKGEFLFHYILNSKDAGTNVTLNGEVKGLKGISAFFFKLFAGSFKKACVKDLQSLHHYLLSQEGK